MLLCSIICALFPFGTAAPLPPPPPPFAQPPLPRGPLHPQSIAAMEDLSSLRLSLGVRSVRTAPGQVAPPEDEGLGAPSLAQEIYRKYAGKTQPESRQLVAILGAVQVRGGAGRACACVRCVHEPHAAWCVTCRAFKQVRLCCGPAAERWPCAWLDKPTAMQEVVRGQGLEVTPTAMFAALMARCSGMQGWAGWAAACRG